MENLPTYRLTQSGPEAQEILDQVNLNTIDIEQLKRLYQALNQSDPEIIEPNDTWPVANPEENVIYRVIDRVNTPPQYYSDYMWNGTSMVPMAQYNNAIDNEPTANSNNLVKSGGVYSFVHANGGAYDISAAHAVGGVLATYDDLADALGTNGANVPAAVRKGGMSIKYVNSSDNKYLQARCMAQNFTTDVAQWQGVDDVPTQGSDNLIKSGGVYNNLYGNNYFIPKTHGYISTVGKLITTADSHPFVRTNLIEVQENDVVFISLIQDLSAFGAVASYGANGENDFLGWIVPHGDYTAGKNIVIEEGVSYIAASAREVSNPILVNRNTDDSFYNKIITPIKTDILGLNEHTAEINIGISQLFSIVKNFQPFIIGEISVSVEESKISLNIPSGCIIGLAGIKRCYKSFNYSDAVEFPITTKSWQCVYIDYNSNTNLFVGDLYIDKWAIPSVATKDNGIFAIPIILTDDNGNIVYNLSYNPQKNVSSLSEEVNNFKLQVTNDIVSKNYYEDAVGGYINQDGTFSDGNPTVFERTPYIPVNNGDCIFFSIDVHGAETLPCIYGYGDNKEPIQQLLSGGVYDKKTLVIPENIHYIVSFSRIAYNPFLYVFGKNLSFFNDRLDTVQSSIDTINDVLESEKSPTTTLYRGYVNSEDWANTGLCTIADNSAVINSEGVIYLKREYSLGRMMYKTLVTGFASSVFYLGNHDLENNNWSTKIFKFNCPLSKAEIFGIEVPFNDVSLNDTDTYAIEIFKLHDCDNIYEKDDHVRCKVYNTRTLEVVVDNYQEKSQTLKDILSIGIEADGVSPTIEKFEVFSLVNKPYIYIVGDSITEGADTSIRYGDLIGKQLNKPYIISGRSAGTRYGILGTNNYVGKIVSEISFIRPTYVMIMIGTNGGGTIQQYTDMCNRIMALGSKVILNNIPCHKYNGVEVAGETNTIIEQVRENLKLNGVLMNIATSLNNDGVNTNESLFNTGTNFIHPNKNGNIAMYLRTFEDVPELYTDADVIPINTLNI